MEPTKSQSLAEQLAPHLPLPFARLRRRVAKKIAEFALPQEPVDKAFQLIADTAHLDPGLFVDAALDHLSARYLVDHVELDRIPTSGPLIVIANHPLGAVDALCLLSMVARRRRDVKILANQFLSAVTPLAPWMIKVDAFKPGSNLAGFREAEMALENGQCVVIFPAGEVSRLTTRGIQDRRWNSGFAKLAGKTKSAVLPVHIGASNSAFFYLAATLHSGLGSLLLPREALCGKPLRVEMRVGMPMYCKDADVRSCKQFVVTAREQVYALPTRHCKPEEGVAIASAESPRAWLDELNATELLSVTSEGRELRIAKLAFGSALLEELGRVREHAFRAVGEGSGKARDLDRFDAHYDHLLLFDRQALEIVGAYRFGRAAAILPRFGVDGLYTASLFEFDQSLLEHMPHAMELGRSFIQPRWFRSRALDELWTGIGHYLRRYPEIRWLFGPVSASADLSPQAHAALFNYYERFYATTPGLAKAKRPFIPTQTHLNFHDLDSAAAMRVLRSELKRMGASIPTLFKQYIDLTEPGGASFLAFGVDPTFGNCVDGLVLVDLTKVKAAKAARWLVGSKEEVLRTKKPISRSIDDAEEQSAEIENPQSILE
jgi:putative hemolysin